MKQYAERDKNFVLSPDFKTIYCPMGKEFKTSIVKGKTAAIHFHDSCSDCTINSCKGQYQKQYQMQVTAIANKVSNSYED